MNRSHRWELRSLEEFKKSDNESQALYGILQGNTAFTSIWVRLLKENHTEVLRWMIVCETDLEGEELKYQTETLRKFILPYLDGMDALVFSSKEEFAQQVIKGVKPFAGDGSI